MRKPLLLLPLAALTLAGFGCKQPVITTDGQIPSVNENPTAQAVAYTPEMRHDNKQPRDFSREIATIRQGLVNLGQANSFRATLILPGANAQQIQSSLSFNRSQGVRGQISMPNETGAINTAELYLNNDQILFKSGNGAWEDMTNTSDGKKMADVLQQAFSFNQNHPAPVSILDSAFIASQTNDPSGCTLYDVVQSMGGEVQTYRVCVAGDMATAIDIDTPNGLVRINYTNINGDVAIEKPKL